MATVPVKQPYTCISCQVAFANPELQRAHFKTDWHRYNLKRKVAELPSVTATVFQEKVMSQKMVDANEAASKLSQYCKTCHKSFTNTKSLQSHERSRKHKEMVEKVSNGTSHSSPLEDVRKKPEHKRAVDNDMVTEVTEEIEADENEPLETTECLFCPHYESSMEANIAHMSKAHGFFIPDLEFLVDLEGLVKYLGEKVGVANMCIYCNEKGKQFYSIEAVQHHMTEKGHCKIMFEGDYALEYADHYDYTKSYPDKEIGNSSEELPTPDHSLTVNNDLELVLPSGVLIGHRYLKNYYKQNVPVKERKKATTVSRVNRVMAQYRSLGWSGLCEAHGRKGRDEKWAHKMRQQRSLNISVKANKFQTYLRPQVVF